MTALGVLLVEDDDAISAPLSRGLTREGYDVTLAVDGPAGLSAGLSPQVALVILDVGLPFLDGLEVCRRLRAARPKLQILLLTARSEEVHAVDGLDAGADDYIAKPFGLAELLARIRAGERRLAHRRAGGRLTAGSIEIDGAARRASVDGRDLILRPKEFDLLALLVAESGRVVTRERIIDLVWDEHWQGSTKTLDVHIVALRRKLSDAGQATARITTLRGVGYRLDSG